MILSFIVAGLATWRISALLVRETGPANIFQRLRTRVVWSNSQLLIGIFGCLYCMSLYVGFFCTILALSKLWIILWPFAMSGAAIAMDNAIGTRKRIPDGERQRSDPSLP